MTAFIFTCRPAVIVLGDKEEQRRLAEMGWHCITVWECELTPKKREETLESIAFTLNHISLQDHGAKAIPYPKLDEEDMQMPMAAEEKDGSTTNI